ncbi:MAG TPA: MoxR family ATPase, partial [Longimicrobium sp.]
RAGSAEDRDYITYVALGLAIVLANPDVKVQHLLPHGFEHPGKPRRSVVLIDEVDKAPRDFPNDILNELDRMFFRIPELGSAPVGPEPGKRPVVVITSNSERHLPDAFLRRCVYYDLPFPGEARLRTIVERRLGGFGGASGPLLDGALEFFHRLRTPAAGLKKPPATGELLDWLLALRGSGAEPAAPLHHQPARAAATLSALAKGEDAPRAAAALRAWIESRRSTVPADAQATVDQWLHPA